MLDLLNFDAIIVVVDMLYVFYFLFYLCIHLSAPSNLYFCVTQTIYVK